MGKILTFLRKHCYEILGVILLFHLYGSVFFNNIEFYGNYVRIVNTIFLYLSSLIVFYDSRYTSKTIFTIMVFTFVINLTFLFLPYNQTLNSIRNFSYLTFLIITFYNIALFLKSPNRLGVSLISASVSGYLLIIEVFVRLFMILNSETNQTLLNVDFSFHTNTFIDIVYFCTSTITSVGYGDILPKTPATKMLSSLLGLCGQFYLVIVMSIMVGKFISTNKKNTEV